ncbi:unnamed protein product [Sphagnum balticum]
MSLPSPSDTVGGDIAGKSTYEDLILICNRAVADNFDVEEGTTAKTDKDGIRDSAGNAGNIDDGGGLREAQLPKA